VDGEGCVGRQVAADKDIPIEFTPPLFERPLYIMLQMDARDIAYTEEFDLIGAFDVVEHIEEDKRVLIPGDGAVFTVPQHPWLWSEHAERACHKRRYQRHELSDKLQRADIRIIFSNSSVSFLPLLLAVPRRHRHGPSHTLNAGAEFNLPAPANAFLYPVLGLDKSLITQSANLPASGTRLVAAIKVASSSNGATWEQIPSELTGPS
jgi:hypothetical protein